MKTCDQRRVERGVLDLQTEPGSLHSESRAGNGDRWIASVRHLEKVALHADLTMLAHLSSALARAREVVLAAV